MIYTHVMIRYGELTLKGKNRGNFIDCLYTNIKKCFADMKSLEIIKQFDKMYLKINQEEVEEILYRLKNISGISSYSLVVQLPKDIEGITATVLQLVKDIEEDYPTFKVITSRNDKSFPLNSDDINRAVATVILKNTKLKVDVHKPKLIVRIEVRNDAVYISNKNYEGLKGFPLGINGKALLMISGGIDSPVAGFMMMKKGVKIAAIHFSSPPYTSEMAIFKVKSLLQNLAKIQGDIKFYNVPFTNLQLEIYKNCGDSYAITIMRRMMYRIADYFLKKEKYLCLVNGESVGQVASQTLESMRVINSVTNSVVIRPLAVYDKLEIINIAKEINTYDTSILPFEDCCTIFDPKNPVTKPRLHECEFKEKKFDYEKLLQECIENTVIEHIKVLKEDE